MSAPDRPRRAYGTGSLEIRTDKHGRETYYARFYAGHRQVRRKLGPKRGPGQTTGLTKPAAERKLQKLIEEHVPLVPMAERVNLSTAGER